MCKLNAHKGISPPPTVVRILIKILIGDNDSRSLAIILISQGRATAAGDLLGNMCGCVIIAIDALQQIKVNQSAVSATGIACGSLPRLFILSDNAQPMGNGPLILFGVIFGHLHNRHSFVALHSDVARTCDRSAEDLN